MSDSTWHNLGDGLYYGKSVSQAPAYRFIWRIPGRGRARDTRTLCLGTENEINHSDAKRLATYAHNLVAEGRDPIKERRAALTWTKKHWDNMP